VSRRPIPVLLYEIIQEIRARDPDRIPLIGVAGAQGSGKSYQCRLLAMENQPRFAHFSLDDVYMLRRHREERAAEIHSLLVTRGVPGTHDLSIARARITQLRHDNPPTEVQLPRFDKATDARLPREAWPIFQSPADAIVMDGWCLGASPQDDEALGAPVNELEEGEDADGVWRRYVNEELSGAYRQFFDGFDAIVYLRPPNWEIVRTWRKQQEEQTLGRPLNTDEEKWLDRFLMHYERITRSMMEGHHRAKWIVHLDEARKVTRIEER
jgi:D-glycerate 3-kinase